MAKKKSKKTVSAEKKYFVAFNCKVSGEFFTKWQEVDKETAKKLLTYIENSVLSK